MKKINLFATALLSTSLWSIACYALYAEAIVIDHNCTDLTRIPSNWIVQAKSQFKIAYGHTSHGSQLITGMNNIKGLAGSLYWWDASGSSGGLSVHDHNGDWGDLGSGGDLTWRDTTVAALAGDEADRNVIMWAWCGGVSVNSAADIDTYLNAMNQLESDYPSVRFIYMTGHLDGTGSAGNLTQRNNQIRQYCRDHNKILFDFADIESYDPSGNEFMSRDAADSCDYNGGNWAVEWCTDNPDNEMCACSDCDCQHSHILNCNLKGRATWWMLARMAGWSGTNETIPNPPSWVQASQGDYTGQVLITWQTVTNATGYCVWRSLTNNTNTAALVSSNITSANYTDTTIIFPPYTNYYYWLKASNSAGLSVFSSSATGWVAGFSEPTNVTAACGTYSNKVVVSWSTVGTATGYEVWRSLHRDRPTAVKISTDGLTSNTWDDTAVTNNWRYYYWVRGTNSTGAGAFSQPVIGYPVFYIYLPWLSDLL